MMSGQNTYSIDLTRLPLGTHRFDFLLDDDFFASVEKSEVLGGKVNVSVTLHLWQQDYDIDIAVHGSVFARSV